MLERHTDGRWGIEMGKKVEGGKGMWTGDDARRKPFLAGIARRVCLLVLAAVFAGMSSMTFGGAQKLQKNISLACMGQELTGAEAEEIREKEQGKESQMEFTAWIQKYGRYVSQPDGSRAVITDVIEMNGSSELIFPYGKILSENDMEGCLLGKGTAEKLFGSRNASGLTVAYGGREFTVRGVLNQPEDILAVEAGSEGRFDRIALRPAAGMTAALTAERFTQAYGIEAEQLRYDMLGAEYFTELIPGKWSDFDGWRVSFAKAADDIGLLYTVQKGGMELVYLKQMCQAACYALLGVFFLVAGAGKRGTPQRKDLHIKLLENAR